MYCRIQSHIRRLSGNTRARHVTVPKAYSFALPSYHPDESRRQAEPVAAVTLSQPREGQRAFFEALYNLNDGSKVGPKQETLLVSRWVVFPIWLHPRAREFARVRVFMLAWRSPNVDVAPSTQPLPSSGLQVVAFSRDCSSPVMPSFTRDTFEDYDDAQGGSLPWGALAEQQVNDGEGVHAQTGARVMAQGTEGM